MATHDYVIANASGSSVRQDINNALAAIVTNNSNDTSPATTYPYQWWADTTTGQLKLRASDNLSWITIFELDGTMLMEDGTVSAPGLAFASDLNTGFFRSAADKINFATGGAERLEIGSSEVVFNDPSNDVDFRVESNGNANMLFVDGGNDRVGVGIGTPTSVLDVRDTQTGAASEIKLFNLDQGNTTTQTSALVMTPDVRANGAKIAVVKEIADFSSAANKDVAITFSPVLNNAAVEAARIDSSGRLLVGNSSSRSIGAGSAFPAKLQIESSGFTNTSFVNNTNDEFGPEVNFGKSRGTSAGSNTVVQSGDQLGIIQFAGADGTDLETNGAAIECRVDGTPGSNDMPGRLVFSTTADGASSPTERVRIDSSGNLGVGLTSLSAAGFNKVIRIKSTTGAAGILAEASDASSWLGLYGGTSTNDSAALLYPNTGSLRIGSTSAVGTTSFSEKLRIDSDGRLLAGTSSTSKQTRAIFQGNSAGSATAEIVFAADTNSPTGGLANLYFSDNGHNNAAIIACVRDGGTWTSGSSHPVSLQFYTTPDGSSTPTERVRIDSSGNVGIGATGPASKLQIIQNSTNNTPLSHNYPATQSGILVDNQQTGTTGAFTAVTLRAYNSSSVLQGASIIAQSTGSGYSANLLFTQRSGSGTNAERMRIQSSGGISFNGDTAAANALDDYEEGDFSPNWGSGLTSASYVTQSGKYTKIGRTVYFTIQLSTNGGTANSSAARIDGLPFNAIGTSVTGGAFVNYVGGWGIDTPYFYKNQNDGTLSLYDQAAGSALAGNAGNGIDNLNLYVMGFYHT